MPTFNGQEFVETALLSLLRQGQVDLEVVVTDDGSADATPQILRSMARKEPRIRFAVQPHSGMAAARNACLARAQGSYISLLDQDDVCPNGKLARQLALLEESPDMAAVFGLTETFDVSGAAAPGYTMLLSAGLIRRETFDRVGRFDPAYQCADDLDFLLRLIESGQRLELEPEVGIHHRRHPGQASSDRAVTHAESVRALAQSLRRRRSRGQGSLDHPLLGSYAAWA